MDFWVYVVIGSVAAAFVQGLAGFGFGMVSLAIWSWVLEPALAVPAVVFGSLVGQLLAVGSLRKGFNWGRLQPFLIGGVIGIPTGLWLLKLLDPLLFKFGLGLLLAVYCTIMLFLPSIPRIKRGGRKADGLIGWVGGTMSGFGGLPGAIPTLWCTLRDWPKDQQRNVFQTFNLLMHILTLSAFALNGMITSEVLWLFALVGPVMVIPSLVAIRLYRRFSDSSFKVVVLGLLALSGVMLLISTAPQVWRLVA
ncbi:sulfite exporter TauE/SafE family protein [Pusillimonas sp. MFBS29]|uniref:sulfite exporter TauE/SafE family protein n=1 Tax=Pusillimonas sp. MFBS29 TaxID=2886690 RepID=UPI001D115BBD|nr:sulfite exporter TauE/SafE family protein [Pusillimonas sp. MFBS29]MCC2597629.1 sulfite exporter TauE/SafE family protein [Pusillimonas sp. MFBS29]